ncbi:MAG: type II secretion system protein [Planctomycetota bacterium]|jgi:prepilin-type N-terminal cleavage/methylation domain-containing protein
MRQREAGMTLIEILVVITILATLAGMVTVLINSGRRRQIQIECIQHVSQMVGLLEATTGRYPEYDGPNLLLYFAKRGSIQGPDALAIYFCAGDMEESLKAAGGVEAYRDLDLALKGEYGHLTSYAARALTDPRCRVPRGSPVPTVLLADDSEDHHFAEGIVVGLTGGSAKFRDKVDDYGLDHETVLIVGEGSAADELTCLRTE